MNFRTIKIRLLDPDAKLPEYAHIDDAGMDLFSIENTTLPIGASLLVRVGISIELPEDIEAQIRPRSGLALKHQITILNSPGTIDPGYRGEIGVILINHGKKAFKITKGMRIAQLVFQNIVRARFSIQENLKNSQRGTDGYGSTGI